jgi:imidazolonepropionase
MRTLYRHARLATMNDDLPWGWVERGALLVDGEHLAWVGADDDLPTGLAAEAEVDLGGALVTPGLVDCHTHLVYGGDRAAEFELRLRGATYEQIARPAAASAARCRHAPRQRRAAVQHAAARARCLMAEGVTTIEVKSGYGLSRGARGALPGGGTPAGARAAADGAHHLAGRACAAARVRGPADDYVDTLIEWLPSQVGAGLVDAVDVFCDHIAFTPAQTERIFAPRATSGLPVKLHAEQLSDQGGAALAAGYGALSCDHLEHLSADGVAAMAEAGTVAVLLPGAYYFLRDTRLPPVQALREAGVPIALATDHNPGSSPVLSLLLMLNMACTLFRLTPEEAWRGVTVHGARALGLADRGRARPRARADFAVWDAEHPREMAYRFGHNPCRRSFHGGVERAR